MTSIALSTLASVAAATLACALPASATSRMEEAFLVLGKTATGSAAEALQAAQSLLRLQERLVKRLPQTRATGLVAVATYLHERDLAVAVEECLSSGVTPDEGLFPALRGASLRWVDRAELVARATLRKLQGADLRAFFADLRTTVTLGWDYVLRLHKGPETFRADALEATVAKAGERLRRSFLAFQRWALKAGADGVREAFEETLLLLQEGIVPGLPKRPTPRPAPAASQPIG